MCRPAGEARRSVTKTVERQLLEGESGSDKYRFERRALTHRLNKRPLAQFGDEISMVDLFRMYSGPTRSTNVNGWVCALRSLGAEMSKSATSLKRPHTRHPRRTAPDRLEPTEWTCRSGIHVPGLTVQHRWNTQIRRAGASRRAGWAGWRTCAHCEGENVTRPFRNQALAAPAAPDPQRPSCLIGPGAVEKGKHPGADSLMPSAQGPAMLSPCLADSRQQHPR